MTAKQNRYEPQKIEQRWQEQWLREGMYHAADGDARPKSFVLVEFPYPSGEGLHVGHCLSYIAQDIVARTKRMQGHNVLYPMGWDAFGLPAENFAIKHKIKPQDATRKNIANFKRQIQSLGISFDWTREVNTTDPKYYRWTQWIFLQLFKHGLAEKKEVPINWCPKDKIGLAFEEVIDGKCERCGTQTEKRVIKQWVLKITKYADRLIDDLETVDYLPEIKQQQINWIGRSEGALIPFEIKVDKTKNEIHNSKLKFLFLHAFRDTSQSAFWPWLKKEVEKRGHEVTALDLPDTENPNIEKQVDFILKEFSCDERSVIVTHSLGGVAAMKLLPKLKTKIARLILVSPPLKAEFLDGIERPVLKTATDWKFDFNAIRDRVNSITVLADDHDHIVPRQDMQEIANNLNARFILGHGNETHYDGTMEPDVLEALFESVKVFTTRPDTLFGATYLVLSPEHPLITHHPSLITNGSEVQSYVQAANKKTERERQESKEKTGVELKGIKAINPANKEEIPIWVADYVLSGYGTGAIMAVPAHDERDFEFAKKYNIPIRQVIAPHFIDTKNPPRDGLQQITRTVIHAIVRRPSDNKYLTLQWKGAVWGERPPRTFIIGGVEKGEDRAAAGIREIHEETGYRKVRFVRDCNVELHTEYAASHKNENRYAKIHLLEYELEDEERDAVPEAEMQKHEPVWLDAKGVLPFLNVVDGPFEWEWYTKGGFAFSGEGVVINSGTFDGMSTEKARDAITKYVGGEKKVQYKLRDWIFSRQHYWGEPIPIVICEKCGYVPLDEKDLPLELPNVDYYEPTDTGESPLAKIDAWVNVSCPKCGGAAKRETDTMPNWAGSSWYYLRYTDPQNDKAFADANKLKYWLPVDLYNGGSEHTTLHVLYSRFWHKFLYDIKKVPTPEPYQRRVQHGMILGTDGQKMSKSRGNVINPDEIVEKYGADTFRLYMMFMGEYDQVKQWSDSNLQGVARFMSRLWQFASNVSILSESTDAELSVVNRAILKVQADLDRRSFNTTVSALMICLNALQHKPTIGRFALEQFTRLLAPFVPHIAEELWHEILARNASVHLEAWPEADASLESEAKKIAVQVNGKVRAEVTIKGDMDEAAVREQVLALPAIASFASQGSVKKFIYVKDKIVSIVIE